MSDRLEKIGNEITKELAPILDEATRQLLPGQMVTIMEVKVTPDLGLAKIYLSVFNSKDKQASMDIIEENSPAIRKYLAGEMRHVLRKVPELKFFLDETIDQAQKIEDLLSKIRKNDEDDQK